MGGSELLNGRLLSARVSDFQTRATSRVLFFCGKLALFGERERVCVLRGLFLSERLLVFDGNAKIRCLALNNELLVVLFGVGTLLRVFSFIIITKELIVLYGIFTWHKFNEEVFVYQKQNFHGYF